MYISGMPCPLDLASQEKTKSRNSAKSLEIKVKRSKLGIPRKSQIDEIRRKLLGLQLWRSRQASFLSSITILENTIVNFLLETDHLIIMKWEIGRRKLRRVKWVKMASKIKDFEQAYFLMHPRGGDASFGDSSHVVLMQWCKVAEACEGVRNQVVHEKGKVRSEC